MKVKIRKPFYNAFKTYGWKDSTPGIGLRKNLLLKAIREGQELEIETEGRNYTLNPQKAYDYAKKKKTMFLAKFNTLLYVIPMTMLELKVGDNK